MKKSSLEKWLAKQNLAKGTTWEVTFGHKGEYEFWSDDRHIFPFLEIPVNSTTVIFSSDFHIADLGGLKFAELERRLAKWQGVKTKE